MGNAPGYVRTAARHGRRGSRRSPAAAWAEVARSSTFGISSRTRNASSADRGGDQEHRVHRLGEADLERVGQHRVHLVDDRGVVLHLGEDAAVGADVALERRDDLAVHRVRVDRRVGDDLLPRGGLGVLLDRVGDVAPRRRRTAPRGRPRRRGCRRSGGRTSPSWSRRRSRSAAPRSARSAAAAACSCPGRSRARTSPGSPRPAACRRWSARAAAARRPPAPTRRSGTAGSGRCARSSGRSRIEAIIMPTTIGSIRKPDSVGLAPCTICM